jgi:hypothetical protein
MLKKLHFLNLQYWPCLNNDSFRNHFPTSIESTYPMLENSVAKERHV